MIALAVMADPPVRPDGRCAVCGKPRPTGKAVRNYARDAIDSDPFCSAVCCRRWHSCELGSGPEWDRDHHHTATGRA